MLSLKETLIGRPIVVANVDLRKKTSNASAVQVRAKPNVVVPAVASRPDDSIETARVPKADKTTFSDRWRLTTRRPPSCSHCRHDVDPGIHGSYGRSKGMGLLRKTL
jgi:hypothetical protein